jgi:hypothetical protein
MVPLISRDRRQDQRAVVGKKPEAEVRKGQVAGKSALGREPSCCLQDAVRLGPGAKLRQRNALDRKPSCCWQDLPVGAFGHAVSAAGDSVAPAGGGLGDSASNRQDAPGATCADCLNTPVGKSDRKRSYVGDSRADAGAGRRVGYKRLAGDDSKRVGKLAGNNSNADHSSGSSRSESKLLILPRPVKIEPLHQKVHRI